MSSEPCYSDPAFWDAEADERDELATIARELDDDAKRAAFEDRLIDDGVGLIIQPAPDAPVPVPVHDMRPF